MTGSCYRIIRIIRVKARSTVVNWRAELTTVHLGCTGYTKSRRIDSVLWGAESALNGRNCSTLETVGCESGVHRTLNTLSVSLKIRTDRTRRAHTRRRAGCAIACEGETAWLTVSAWVKIVGVLCAGETGCVRAACETVYGKCRRT
jgi:hypothetical protein